jgi:hypothetical protein
VQQLAAIVTDIALLIEQALYWSLKLATSLMEVLVKATNVAILLLSFTAAVDTKHHSRV